MYVAAINVANYKHKYSEYEQFNDLMDLILFYCIANSVCNGGCPIMNCY